MKLLPTLPTLLTLPKLPHFEMKLGSFPPADSFIPESPITQIGTASVALLALQAAHSVSNNGWVLLGTTATTLAGLYIYGRHASRAERNGYLLDEPYQVKGQKLEGNTNWEVTKHFQKIESFENTVITETRSEQYRILKIKNTTPKKVKEQMAAISMLLGIDEKELQFIQNYQKGVSAILAPLPPKKWLPVPFDTEQLDQGKLIGYVGKTVSGEHVTYNREIEPHLLIAGDTNSGKTEAIRVDMASMRASGLNPEIYIIDPKEDMEGEECQDYTSDLHQGVALLESLSQIADERKSKYNKAGCKNYFEYQRKINADEKPIMVYIDETADLLAPDLLEKVEEGEHPLHKRAFSILYYISRKNRAAGLFLTLGIQHPKSETLKTEIRNNLGARLVLSMADSTASKVALGKTGAETLPKFGAFMFKTSLTNAPIIGRGAYIQ